MKKFIIGACTAVLLVLLGYTAYYHLGIYVDLDPGKPVTAFMKTEGKSILMEREGEYVPFEIRGINLGAGLPGEWATDYAIDVETYLRWFQQIQELGANTIRVYVTLHDDFYNAFYEYNTEREAAGEEPLWLIHGVWVNDYMQNSRRDAYDGGLLSTLVDDCKALVDILHGQRSLVLGRGTGSGSYRRDVSRWVLGYIIGVEWEGSFVAYTDQRSEGLRGYEGTYLYTDPEATAFETFLCRVGDRMIEYESQRYKHQRLVAFSNWPTTDPFAYPAVVILNRHKVNCVNVEHIRQTEAFRSGMFASYHVYPYFPDFLEMIREINEYTAEELDQTVGRVILENLDYRTSLLNAPPITDYLQERDYQDSQGRYNTYIAYLRALNRFHSLPVVISEYGTTTGRGMAQRDVNTGRNQGYLTEQEQGRAIVECYQDIMDAGCTGSCLFIWQDEWFKRTWNTMNLVDRDNCVYWSDCQTNEQHFGLLTFDPGKEKSICYVDGDLTEWTEEDQVITFRGLELSMKYDEKFVYFLVRKEGLDQEGDYLYIPLDVTPKSGSTCCEDYGRSFFERPCDFLIMIRGRNNSRVLVQRRYEALRSTYAQVYYAYDPYVEPPPKDAPWFDRIYLPLTLRDLLPEAGVDPKPTGTKYETGLLRHGNANPDAADFDSLADFMFGEDAVEIRLPWQLLNFSNPSEMMIHDDYYEHYGIEDLHIDEIYAGVGCYTDGKYRIPMSAVPLKGWGKYPASHERLKQSYYILQTYWAALDQEAARLGK